MSTPISRLWPFSGTLSIAGYPLSEKDLDEVFARIQARSGFCGLTGPCGIVPALGAVLAYLLGSKCGVGLLRRSFPQYPLKSSPVTCLWSKRHPHGCRKSKCPYWPGINPPREVSHETGDHHYH